MDKPYKNSGLFSDHYLSDILPRLSVWDVDPEKLEKAFSEMKTLFQNRKDELPELSEASLEERYIRPILRAHLGHIYEVQSGIPHTIEGTKKPDYAFFSDEETRAVALKAPRDEFFGSAIAVGEVKQWGRPLDKKLKTEKDPFEIQNPSLQMSRYLWLTGAKWGILTDGQFWRLYERETSKRIDIYYEINLLSLLERGTVEDFKYFYIFFDKKALVREADGKCLLDKIYQGSIDYREDVSGELKGNVYQALRLLAEGFLKNPANSLSTDSLQEIHDNSLVFLYRLLFILYAEYRDLLPMTNPIYRDNYSLYALKREIAENLDTNAAFSQTMSHYHGKLKELFEVINVGNKELGVPPYNGGLFDPSKHPFLEKCRVGDSSLAQVVNLLSRSRDKAFVDYSSLEIRHLGSIYEGLLEYKLKMADKDMAAIKDKKEVWISASEIEGNPAIGGRIEYKKKGYRVLDLAPQNSLYLTTDKGERKATGSYYTPSYIVEYIIQNTLDPLIEEKKKKVEEKVENREEKYKTSRGYNREVYEKELKNAKNSIIDEILSIKVLDPAMGSGHFLVEATNFLAHALARALSGTLLKPSLEEAIAVKETSPSYAEKEFDEEDIRWARREVIEKCIFGADLNPLAVELAKLSLWLTTVAKDKPLSFLEHHLKCGNSLIGAKLDNLKALPKVPDSSVSLNESNLIQSLKRSVKSYLDIERMPSENLEDVDNKGKILETLNKLWLDQWRKIANLWTSTYFGIELPIGIYRHLCEQIPSTGVKPPGKLTKEYLDLVEPVAKEKQFFHWELEFPEIFFDEFGRELENPGFDAVVGNPPYRTLALGKGQQSPESDEVVYLRAVYPEASQYKTNTFAIFLDKAVNLCRRYGKTSMILPMTLLTNHFFADLRKSILTGHGVDSIVEIQQKVFPDAEIGGNCVIVVSTGPRTAPHREEIAFFEIDEYFAYRLRETIPQKLFLSLPDWKVLSGRTTVELLVRLRQNNIPFKSVAIFYNGIKTGNNKKFLSDSPTTPKHRKVIRGKDVNKYDITFNDIWVFFEPELLWSNTNTEMFEAKQKIIVRQTSDVLIGAFDENQYYTMDTTHLIIPKYNSPLYHLALVNSKLLNWCHRQIVPEEGKAFAEVKIINLEQLPVRRISFATPVPERKKLLEEFKNMHKAWMGEKTLK